MPARVTRLANPGRPTDLVRRILAALLLGGALEAAGPPAAPPPARDPRPVSPDGRKSVSGGPHQIGPARVTRPAAATASALPVVLDTDFAFPPYDDGLALLLALGCPEIALLGVTTVAGNQPVGQATADALRLLELAGRPEVPVYPGAAQPLVHRARGYDPSVHGRWWLRGPVSPPPGGFAARRPEAIRAATFLTRAAAAYPGALTIVAIGPLTNLALAIRRDPAFARRVARLVIMGGAIAALPDGGGNVTPNAEFNFWVDPEAARLVLHSGIPIVLSPLNVSRKTRLDAAWYRKLVAPDTPVTRLLRETLGPLFASQPDRVLLMYDPVAIASAVDPTLVQTVELLVDVDTHRGPNYGVSVGGPTRWPGGEAARRMTVQYDLDWERFIRFFIARVAGSPQDAARRALLAR